MKNQHDVRFNIEPYQDCGPIIQVSEDVAITPRG